MLLKLIRTYQSEKLFNRSR